MCGPVSFSSYSTDMFVQLFFVCKFYGQYLLMFYSSKCVVCVYMHKCNNIFLCLHIPMLMQLANVVLQTLCYLGTNARQLDLLSFKLDLCFERDVFLLFKILQSQSWLFPIDKKKHPAFFVWASWQSDAWPTSLWLGWDDWGARAAGVERGLDP